VISVTVAVASVGLVVVLSDMESASCVDPRPLPDVLLVETGPPQW